VVQKLDDNHNYQQPPMKTRHLSGLLWNVVGMLNAYGRTWPGAFFARLPQFK